MISSFSSTCKSIPPVDCYVALEPDRKGSRRSVSQHSSGTTSSPPSGALQRGGLGFRPVPCPGFRRSLEWSLRIPPLSPPGRQHLQGNRVSADSWRVIKHAALGERCCIPISVRFGSTTRLSSSRVKAVAYREHTKGYGVKRWQHLQGQRVSADISWRLIEHAALGKRCCTPLSVGAGSTRGLSSSRAKVVGMSVEEAATAGEPAATPGPLFSFGVLADIQYADKEDKMIGGLRWYRDAPNKLKRAVEAFNAAEGSLSCVVTLGDIIDGNETPESTLADFEVVAECLGKLKIPRVHHLFGNHCLSLPRPFLLSRLGMPSPYYAADVAPGWRLVILDSMDLSLAWPEGTPERAAGEAYLSEHPASEEAPQMEFWNGGLGAEQLLWLKGQLERAAEAGDKLIVCLHHPLLKEQAPDMLLAWNHQEIVRTLHALPNAKELVPLVLCGHHHPGGYASSEGVHYVNLEAVLEAPIGQDAYAFVDVYEQKICIRGVGVVTTRELEI